MNDLSLEQAVDGFGQRIVVAVANAADRRFDAGFAQPLGVANGQISRAAVAVMHQPPGTTRVIGDDDRVYIRGGERFGAVDNHEDS